MIPSPGPPRTLGPYALEQELASGGQGQVWRARHGPTGEVVALKLLVAAGDSAHKRFAQEARVLARLSHPNIVRVFDHGVEGGTPFLACELVAGDDLKTIVERAGPPPPPWTARLLLTVARAIQHCHEQGVVHRDLKPANILVERPTERPVLVDFGLVKRDPAQLALPSLDDDRQVELSLSGSLKGTPEFMAPEQVHPKHGEVGPATDVYGLGATLYYLLTGGPPFTGESLPALLRKVTRQAPPDGPLRAAPPALARLCLAALAKDPRARPPTAEAFAAALQATGLLSDSGTSSAVRSASGRLAPLSRLGPKAGQRIGPFTLERELGRGAMGVVFAGRADDGREAAVKLMSAAVIDERHLKRFGREVQALSALSHPNVVRILGASTEPGAPPWLAMEFVHGKDLQARLEAQGHLPWDETARLVAQVARGVAHAHARGVFHRDLKPGNILVRDQDGGALVTDFGLARSLEASRFARTGDTVGTLAYMSPEQVKGQRAEGPPCDVWALGAILFRCLADEPPFAAESTLGLAAAIVQGAVRSPRSVRRDVPADLEAVTLACLQRDPAARPTAAQVAAALEARRPLGRARRRPPAVLVAALAVAAVAVVGGAALAARRRGPGGPPRPPTEPGAGPATEVGPPGPAAPAAAPWGAPAAGWRAAWSLAGGPAPEAVAPALWEAPGRVAAPLDRVRAGQAEARAAAFLGQAGPPDAEGRVAVRYDDVGLAVRYEAMDPGSYICKTPPASPLLGEGIWNPSGDAASARVENDAGAASLWLGRAWWDLPRVALRLVRLTPIDLDDVTVRLGAEANGPCSLRLTGRTEAASVSPYTPELTFPFVLSGEPAAVVFAPHVGDGEALRLGEVRKARLDGAARPGPGPVRLVLMESHIRLDRLEVAGRPRRPDVPALAVAPAPPLPAAARVAAAFAQAHGEDLGGALVALLGPDGAPALELEVVPTADGRAVLELRERGVRLASAALEAAPAQGWLALERAGGGDLAVGVLGVEGRPAVRVAGATPLPLGRPLRPAWGSAAARVTFEAVEVHAGPADPARDAWDAASRAEDPPAAGGAPPREEWRGAALRLARVSDPALIPAALLGPDGALTRRATAARAAASLAQAADRLEAEGGDDPAARARVRDALARAVLGRVVGAQAAEAVRATKALATTLGGVEAAAEALDGLERGPQGVPALVERLVKGYTSIVDTDIQEAAFGVALEVAPTQAGKVLTGLSAIARNRRPPPDPRTPDGRADLERALDLMTRAREAGGPAETLDGYQADTLMDLGRLAEAVPCWERLVAAKPNGWYSWLRLAHCHEGLDRPAEALEAALGALALSPQPRIAEQVVARARAAAEARPGLAAAALVAAAAVARDPRLHDEGLALARRAPAGASPDADLAALARSQGGEVAPPAPGDRPTAILVRARAGQAGARAAIPGLVKEEALVRHLALLDPVLVELVPRAGTR